MTDRLTEREMLMRCARAAGKIEQYGARGPSLVSYAEIEAMSVMLVCLGLVPVRLDQDMPDQLFISQTEQKETRS